MLADQLKEVLSRIWSWLGISSDVYARSSSEDYDEYMFPDWDELINITEKLVLQEDAKASNEIWTAVALDHEEENLLDFISEHASDTFVDQLITNVPMHNQPNAKWQAAELIRRRRSCTGERILQLLLHDTDPYVRKRALASYDGIVSKTLEQT